VRRGRPYDRGVLRPSSLPHALAVVAAGVVVLLGGAVPTGSAAAANGESATPAVAVAPAEPEQPLAPRIRSITPDYVPESGPILIRGTVTNDSDRTWTAINVHGFMGDAPLTTAAELEAASQVPATADVGHRITVPGTFASIASLVPGQSASFEVRLPRRDLPLSSPGVYWFGVHVLGDDGRGGPRVAVGRDRTFLPFVPVSSVPAGEAEDTALVVPVRAGVVRGPDGTVVDPDAWGRSLQSGPLHALAALGRAARGHQLTWLVDPAVPDVVRRLARDNPARTLTSPIRPHPGGDDQSPSAPASASGADSTSADASGASGSVPTEATHRQARRWLVRMHTLFSADTGQVLGLPYGDLAVEPAALNDRPLLLAALRRGARALTTWGLAASPAVAPPDGRTTSDAIGALPRETDVLLPDSGVRGGTATVNRTDGHPVVVLSSAAAHGGPGPINPHSSLALRQRVLAEAALRVLGDREPLVVELPSGVHDRIRPSFFSGLDVPWLRLTTYGGATAVPSTRLAPSRLRAPPPGAPQLGPRVYSTARVLLDGGSILQSVLTDNHTLRKRLFEDVAGNASYAAQLEPYLALSRMRVTEGWVHDNLDRIALAAPVSVTLASTSGRFSAIVSNDLDVPVTVKVRAVSDTGLRITGGEKVKVAPHGRSPVLLNASTDERGVHTVTLELTNAAGRPLGASDSFPMRAEQVSRLIWVIIGVGVVLLFAAIVVRLTRRILRARSGPT
jgi:hypothetical protein